jgi:hypothetical protein
MSGRADGPDGLSDGLSLGAMDMTAEEVKQFWRDFCQRRGIGKDIVARGEAKIDENPDYWADQTMGRLLDLVSH